jgi:fimbrial chaperone protein
MRSNFSIIRTARLRIASVLASLLCFSLLSSTAWAGVFSVSPMRIHIDPKNRAVAVTVTNEGDEELVMQADLYLWKQKPGGEEDLSLTEDVFLSPPIFKVPPKSRQVVRLATLRQPPTTQQLSYRIILREIVEARPAKEGMQVQIALAFSIPIFMTPPAAKHQLACEVQRVTASSVKAVCENTGNAFVLPRQFLLTGALGGTAAKLDSGGYILPGIKRSFEIKHTAPIPAGKAKLTATLDDASTQNFEISVAE